MSNSVYEFVPLMGTNEIYRAGNTNACLEDDLVEMTQDIADRALIDHDHEGYASADHNHDEEYAAVDHTHDDGVADAPLWTGAKFVLGTTNINLSKNLSDCKNGIILVWSHYNTTTEAASDADFCTTVIPKKKHDGTAWNGESYIAHVPVAMTNDAEVTICKRLYIHNNKIVGHAANELYPRNDAVLRAVWEF